MATYTRSIARITSSSGATSLPAWRKAMLNADTVYQVGASPGTQALTWPGGIANPAGYTSGDCMGGFDAMIDSYGGAVYAEDVGGPYGSMLYFSTGEDQFAEQIMAMSLYDDSPSYAWFQQPGFVTTLAAATAAGSDLYYNATDYAALAMAQKIDAYATEAGWLTAWRAAGSTFPVGWKNWVYWRKPDTFTQGSGSPWCFRYHANQFLPAAITGTGSPALVVNQHNAYGPFRAWPPAFNTITDAEWSSNVWPGTSRRKFGIHAMNLNSKAWERLSGVWVPDMAFGGFTTYTHSARDDYARRIYYKGRGGIYHLDLSSGLVGASMSSAVDHAGSADAPFSEGNGALVTNDPLGRKLWYFQSVNTPNTLIVYDLVAQTSATLDLSARGLSLPATPGAWPSYYPYVPMLGGYDPVNNKVHFVNIQRGGPAHCHSFTVPTGGVTSAANYTVNSRQLALASGVSYPPVANDRPVWGYGDRCKYLPALGVCLLPQPSGAMLAFRPA